MDERQRLSRDLHDLLGHALSMNTLKSELAGRLVEQEPARAVQEIREVEHVARLTLREVREAVAGYRQPRLESELDGARQILSAAGITCQVEHSAGELERSTDAMLAWAVREGVTNVIRHSRARRCLIRLTHQKSTVCAEVINDWPQRQQLEGTKVMAGSGLSDLSERVNSHGGCIEAGPLQTAGNEGFRLWVELPIQGHVEPSQEERL